MTFNVLMGTLNPAHSLIHFCTSEYNVTDSLVQELGCAYEGTEVQREYFHFLPSVH